jgi:hypothetical protein
VLVNGDTTELPATGKGLRAQRRRLAQDKQLEREILVNE